MSLNRNKLYLFITFACLAGYVWLYFVFSNHGFTNKSEGICIIKHMTNVPCPSCGSTRSVLSLSEGHFTEAFRINPMGYIVAFIMFFSPMWIAFDLASKRKTFFEFYEKMEACLRRPQYSIPLILLVFINWIWNIAKGL